MQSTIEVKETPTEVKETPTEVPVNDEPEPPPELIQQPLIRSRSAGDLTEVRQTQSDLSVSILTSSIKETLDETDALRKQNNALMKRINVLDERLTVLNKEVADLRVHVLLYIYIYIPSLGGCHVFV